MKINIASVAEIKATKIISSKDLVLMARSIAGKKAVVEIDGKVTLDEFIMTARSALAIDPSIEFSDIIIKNDTVILDKSKNLIENLVKDGTSLKIVLKRIV